MNIQYHLKKTRQYLADKGLIATVTKIVRYAARRVQMATILRGSTEDRFTKIYNDNIWLSDESRSGEGSELEFTQNLRTHLPRLFQTYQIKTFLDAPCGDFNWMRHVVKDTGITYIGGDIVKEMVAKLNETDSDARVSFQHLNIIQDALPAADMMMVRECLFHFSYRDTYLFLENFCRHDIPYLLTTTHQPGSFENMDIQTGDYRLINLFQAPYGFPDAPLEQIEDYIPPHAAREMCLFTRDQVIAARDVMARTQKSAAA